MDELYGYVITTSADGGLQVTDIAEDEVLWALPKVRPIEPLYVLAVY